MPHVLILCLEVTPGSNLQENSIFPGAFPVRNVALSSAVQGTGEVTLAPNSMAHSLFFK